MQLKPLFPNAPDEQSTREYRVVQWATGTIGARALRAVIEHPHMRLAGVYVHGQDKVGRDAGELCGTASIGVTATASIDDIVDLGPDCVLYMPNSLNLDELCRQLAAGINVVTTCGAFHHPASMDPEIRAKVQAACELGGSSVHSTGSSPGFITEAVPLVLTSIQRQLNAVTIDEYADLSQRNSPVLLFDLMGFGRPARPFEQFRADYLRWSFGPSLQLVADAIGLPLDSVEASGGLAVASRETGWHVSVDGDAPLEVTLRMPVPLERMAAVSPAYTANRAVNAVPYVCAAAQGIHSTLDLPQVVPALG